MRKLIQLSFLLIIISLASCRVTRPDAITYSWRGKQVTKKEYDKLLYKHTVEFVDNYIKKQTP
jgi:uncharacterized protein involved in tolerance to divalent cations